jgi:hypothetical protein
MIWGLSKTVDYKFDYKEFVFNKNHFMFELNTYTKRYEKLNIFDNMF